MMQNLRLAPAGSRLHFRQPYSPASTGGVATKIRRHDSGIPPAPRHQSIQWLSLRSILYRSLACLARPGSSAKDCCLVLKAPGLPPSLPVANSGSHPPECADFSRRGHRFSSGHGTPAPPSRCMDRRQRSRLRFVRLGTFLCSKLRLLTFLYLLLSCIYLDAPNASPVPRCRSFFRAPHGLNVSYFCQTITYPKRCILASN